MELKSLVALILVSVLVLSGCSGSTALPESRIFLDLSLEFLGSYALPQTEFAGTQVGGLSALAYDRTRDRLYALADDRQTPRFYTFKLNLEPSDSSSPHIQSLTVEQVTLLKDAQGQPIAPATLDPEGMVLTPQQQVVIASEGVQPQSPPLVATFALASGNWQQQVRLPQHFLPLPAGETAGTATPSQPIPQGIADNRGFEALALSPEGDRIFTATELPLRQDVHPDSPNPEFYSRVLHYLVGEVQPLLIAEHLYPLEPPTLASGLNGLTELVAVDAGGHFLSLERSYSPLTGYNAQIFQMAMAGATDTQYLDRLTLPLPPIKPVLKQPLLNLRQLNLPLGNLEGMMWGPGLPDGSRSLLLVSDNGFQAQEPTQFLLFRLQQTSDGSRA